MTRPPTRPALAGEPPEPSPPAHPVPRLSPHLRVMGWVEYVSFPLWKVDAVRAKVDTGARISALHVDSVRKLTDGRIRFEVVLHREQKHLRVTAEAQVLRRSRIKSSNGHYEERFVVPALVRIGDVERDIEVSLVSRPDMVFRMLLGRDALSGFVIDPAREILLGTPRPGLAIPAPLAKPIRKARPKLRAKAKAKAKARPEKAGKAR